MNDAFQDQDRGALLNDALMALEEMQARLDTLTRSRNEPIAIVGMSCRFPGGANDPDKFWSLLQSGGDAIQEVPKDRWDVDAFYDPDPDAPGKTNIRFGAFIDQVDQFDPQFFGISPREANGIDPQQRLVLEVSWEALEGASIATRKLRDSRTGVFIGIGSTDFAHIQTRFGDMSHIDAYTGTGSGICFAAGRLSYTLGLQGPSISLDTACSSSLVTLHLACQSLRLGECDLALAGGVHLMLSPDISIYLSKIKAVAIDGRSKTFDAAADGFSRGEGCGMVVLKRLSDAERDGDNILALILGSAVNQDGASSGLTAPNGSAQRKVIRQALSNANVDAHQVSYIEAHGTGTILGDPIEMGALVATYGRGRPGNRPLVVGSVKTNIGHLEAAAGIAGLIKVVLSLQHNEIPPHLHFNKLNPHITLDDTPIVIPVEGVDWPSGDHGKMAAVSSFGLSGTNVHVILGEPPEPQRTPPQIDRSHQLLCLSANSEAALEQLAQGYAGHLSVHPEVSLADTCFNANAGRSHFEHRLAIVAESSVQAYNRLEEYTAGKQEAGIIRGFASKTDRPKVVFLFTGQGSQYINMGRQLYETQPTFSNILEQCNEFLRPYLEQPLLSVLYPDSGSSSPLDQTAYTQPALFALEYALAALWRSWGIEPAAVMGHSVGEYVAACVAGVFSLEDGLALIAKRGRYMQDLPLDGKMAVVFAEIARVEAAIAPYADKVSIAAVNGPENIVISGQSSAIIAIVDALETQGVAAHQLNVSHAFHSPLMEPILDIYEQTASQFRFHTPGIPLISNLTGEELGYNEIPDAVYWRRHIRQPVQFLSAIETLHTQGFNLFLEIGPSPTLSGMAQRCLPDHRTDWLYTLRKGKEDWPQVLENLGALYARGINVDWEAFDRDYSRQRISVPVTYPFQRRRYWLDLANGQTRARKPDQYKALHPLLERKLRSPMLDGIVFESQLSVNSPPYLNDHRIYSVPVLPAVGYLEMGLAAASQVFGAANCTIEDFEIQEQLILPEDSDRTVQIAIRRAEGGKGSFNIISLEESEGENWIDHATGFISTDIQPQESQQTIALSELQSRCPVEVQAATYYQQLFDLGIEIGPSYRGTQHLWRGEGEALGQVKLPVECIQEVDLYMIHPVLLDACFQLIGIAADETRDNSGEAKIYLPVGLETFQVHSAGYTQLWGHAILREDHEGLPKDVLTGDIRMFDQAGQVVVEATRVRLKPVSQQERKELTQGRQSDWLYQIEWRPKEVELREEGLKIGTDPGSWLILADQHGVGEALAGRLQSQGNHCIMVHPGEDYRAITGDDGAAIDRYEVNPLQKEDFEQLIAKVLSDEAYPYQGAIFLWSLDADEAMTSSSLQADQARICGGALYLAQALVNNDQPKAAKLWLVTRGAQPVGMNQQRLTLVQAPLWGLGKTIALEHPDLNCACLDLDPKEGIDNLEELIKEVHAGDREDQIAFRGSDRYVARLTRNPGNVEAHPIPEIRDDGTYLVSGGCGGLGLNVAQWLVEQGARHLILMGRSGASESAQEVLNELNKVGAQIIVASADVSHMDQIDQALAEIDPNMPPLRGIIHAAGVLDDGLLLHQNWERFARVMAPKVEGAWNLHLLSLDHQVDFFVSFSSMASLLGSMGQANYVAANGFLDALAHYRRIQGLPALSINWGPWEQVGMAAALGDQNERRRAEYGIGTITPNQGKHILEKLLRDDLTQVGVFPVTWPIYFRQFPPDGEPPLFSELVQEAQVQGYRAQEKPPGVVLLEKLEKALESEHMGILRNFVQEQVVKVLGLNPSEPPDERQGLFEIGLDSLMAVELSNRLRISLDRPHPQTLAIEHPTIQALTAYLAEDVSSLISEPPSRPALPETEEPQPAADKALEYLSDDEIEQVLLEELDKSGY